MAVAISSIPNLFACLADVLDNKKLKGCIFSVFFSTSVYWSCVNVDMSVSVCEKDVDHDSEGACIVWEMIKRLLEIEEWSCYGCWGYLWVVCGSIGDFQSELCVLLLTHERAKMYWVQTWANIISK